MRTQLVFQWRSMAAAAGQKRACASVTTGRACASARLGKQPTSLQTPLEHRHVLPCTATENCRSTMTPLRRLS
jgi:hypothetical protein